MCFIFPVIPVDHEGSNSAPRDHGTLRVVSVKSHHSQCVQRPGAGPGVGLTLLLRSSSQLSNAINLKEIAEKTEGYSGSDLRELCRDAAMYRVRDYVRKEQMRQIAQQLGDHDEEEKYDSHSDTHSVSRPLHPTIAPALNRWSSDPQS